MTARKSGCKPIFLSMNISRLLTAGLFCAGIASLAARPAHATPSTLGFYPSTDIYGPQTFHFDADTYQSSDFKNGVFSSSGITYGLGKETNGPFGRTEIGADYNFGSSGPLTFSKRIFGNAKTQLFNNNASQTRVVAGAWGLGDSTLNPNYIYLLGSKNFASVGRVHVGVAHGLAKNYFAGTGRTSLQLGYDRYITPKLQFAVDYYSGKGPASGVQPTLYYYINDRADFGLGYFRLNDSALSNRNQVYVCFDYNFDFKRPVQSTTAAPAPETSTQSPATN